MVIQLGRKVKSAPQTRNVEPTTPKPNRLAPRSNCFEVTMVGDYYAYTDLAGHNTIKRYEVSVIIPDYLFKQGAGMVRSAIVRELLQPALRAKYEDYISFRTHLLSKCVNLDSPDKPIEDLSYMDELQLEEYIRQQGLPVTIDLYPSLTELRDAIHLAKTDPEGHAKNEERLEARDPDIPSATKRDLKSLNASFDYAFYE